MNSYSTENIRNLAIVGHRGSGKTSLAEAALYVTGTVDRLGEVNGGTATTDFTPEEEERELSIAPALCYAEHNGTKINLIDTPGYAEFYAGVVPCLWVADTVVLVLDAASGVEVQSRKVYADAAQRDLPIIAVVNKLDVENADFDNTLQMMKEMLPDCRPVPVQLPMGSGDNFEGIVDLLTMKAYGAEDTGVEAEDIPAQMAEAAEQARMELVEEVASNDEELMEAYFENDSLTREQIYAGLADGIASGALVPVLCTCATRPSGVTRFMHFATEALRSPADRSDWVGEDLDTHEEVTVSTEDSEMASIVWKTIRDPFVGRLSLVRVLSGKLDSQKRAVNTRTGASERLSGLCLINGNETEPIDSVQAGDLACISRLEDTSTGDTLCEPGLNLAFEMPALPEPMHSQTMEAAERAEEDKVSTALPQIAEEDIGFRYERRPDTGELVVYGLGPLHLQIIRDRLERQYNVSVQLGQPQIPYRETATQNVSVQGRHKKQTGGRGQFGDVLIRVEPTPRGQGFEFVDEVKGGSVPSQYIAAVEKGIRDAMERGPRAGYPVVDVRTVLYDGSSHPVDSSDQAFRMAGQIAMRDAMKKAVPTLLEPMVIVEVTCPEDMMGDIMSDLSGRRGRVQGTDVIGGGVQIIKALVPLAEMTNYAADLISMSQGRASFTMEFSHYEEVPAAQQQEIVERSQRQQQQQQ